MVGAVVLATEQGLGYLAKDFFDNGLIQKVYIREHTSRRNHREWYPRSAIVASAEELLACDTLLFFETPFDWSLIPKARSQGKKTVLMPMYECAHYPWPYTPDLVINPSDLDQDYFPEGVRVTVPVPNHIKWRKRSKAKVFVHNAGNGGLNGRNGTRELVEAMKHVKSPLKLIIRSQIPIKEVDDPRIEVRVGSFPGETLYEEGDVFVFPEKFNGLSLPLQEAFASGMLVICGKRFPMTEWLPNEPMIPIEKYKAERLYLEFSSAIYNPLWIANVLDAWYDKNIEKFSLQGKKFHKEKSWQKLRGIYEKLLSQSSVAVASSAPTS